jgi:hypothetical protein
MVSSSEVNGADFRGYVEAEVSQRPSLEARSIGLGTILGVSAVRHVRPQSSGKYARFHTAKGVSVQAKNLRAVQRV